MESLERLKGSTVLVTGGVGFIGSHVVESLLKEGCQIIVPFRALDPRSYFSLQRLDRRVVMAFCDIKDEARVTDIVTKYEVDYIVHIAAQPIVTTAYQNPKETLESNIMGTIHVLEAARKYSKVRGIIVASSDKAYGKSNSAYVETDPLRGDHPYEVSKSAADLIATSYHRTYDMPIVITRFGNVYGPGDLNFNRIVPGIMKASLLGEPLAIRSNGLYIRDYVYVKDVANAYTFLLKRVHRLKGEAYNISIDSGCSVIEVLKKANRILVKKIRYNIENSAINEIPFQKLNTSKIQKLGWKAKVRLDRGLRESYSWYKKNKSVILPS